MSQTNQIENIFEESLLRVAKVYCVLIGVWKWKLTPKLSKLYNAYFIMLYIYLVTFVLSQIYQLHFLITKQLYVELMDNLSISVLYTTAIFQVHLCLSDSMSNLTNLVDIFEKNVRDNCSNEVKQIYAKYSRISDVVGWFYILSGLITLVLYVIFPHVPLYQDLEALNTTAEQKYITFSNWMPFDKSEHIYLTTFMHILAGTVGASYTIGSDTVFVCLFMFCSAALKVLQHFLENIRKYSTEIMVKHNTTYKEAEISFMTKCVILHNDIIQFTQNLDRLLRNYMLINFCQASLKISIILVQLLQETSHGVTTISFGLHELYLLGQLYLFYWNANEIIVQSSDGIMLSVANSEWYEYTLPVKKMLVLIMARTEKPLKIGIGYFLDMNLQTAQIILKGCYTYVCIMHDFDD